MGEGDEIPDGYNHDANHEVNQYQMEQQQDNKQINQESRSYQINRDGQIYQVNEEMKQYKINQGGDNNYQIKKETKTTTTIEKSLENNSQKYPNNNRFSPIEGSASQIKTSIKKNVKILPKDSIPKVYIQSSRFTSDNYTPGRYTQVYSDIPRYMSFQKSAVKQTTSKVHSTVNVVKTEDLSELVEIPRSEYEQYAGRETIFIGGGMDTGEYKFRGQGIIITQTDVPKKIVITEEDILKEINRRKNKPKKEKKIKYEILDKFYNIVEFDGKPIRKIEKVEQQQKQQYEYEEQEKYYSSSKGKVGYQFSSKESQSQQMQNPQYQTQIQTQTQTRQIQSTSQQMQNPQLLPQSQQMQYQQSQQMYSQQFESQDRSQPFDQDQMKFIANKQEIKYSQNQNMENNSMNMNANMNMNMNDNNNNYRYQKLVLNAVPADNFSKYLFEQINKLRTDPKSYIRVIENAKKNIITDKRGRLVYNGKIKIGLIEGESAFDNAINYLKDASPVDKLIFNPYMAVELPKTENEIKYRNDLIVKVENMVKSGMNIKSYWRDIIKDPEISFLMMIVDDNGNNSGMRRKDLLDPNMKYIGISSVEINGLFVCYITLSPHV